MALLDRHPEKYMNKHIVNKENNTDKSGWYVGVDVGGTKIECAVIASGNSPDTIVRRRIPTEGSGGYMHVLQRIASLVREVGDEAGFQPDILGVGTPGTLDPDTGFLRGCNSQHLLGQPFRTDLEALLGIPVVVENDANCLVLAETRMGAVPDLPGPKDVVFGVIMGTGVGGGLVVNGNLVAGANRITGEWGHNHLDDSGGRCWCGRTGCVETLLSGPALENFYREHAGFHLPMAEIADRALSEDSIARQTIDRLLTWFGRGIAGIINSIDPDIIVIGGGVGNIDLLYTHGLKQAARWVFSPTLKTRLVRPALGDSAGVFGAALLAAAS